MAVTQLEIYNAALTHMGAYALSSIGENRESRRVFDAVWARVRDHCLEQGVWHFALRIADLSTAVYAGQKHGFTNAFAHPTDLIHTFELGATADFDPPLYHGFVDQAGHWFTDEADLFVHYTSNDATFGLDFTKWTWTFAEYVAAQLAATTCFRITGNLAHAMKLHGLAGTLLNNARMVDGVVSYPGMTPFNLQARKQANTGGDLAQPFPFVAVPTVSAQLGGGRGE